MNLDQAQTVVNGALAAAAEDDMKALCVVVLDAGGHLLAMARQDGAAFGRFDVARGKASGAISIGVNSRLLEQLALERPHFINGAATAVGGDLVPVAGGVIIVDAEGAHLGAVGISGDTSDNDEKAALAGIAAAGLLPAPGARA